MFSKILAFVIMSVGAMVILGFISAAVPSISRVAVTFGQYMFTWANILFASLLCVVLWLTSKV